MNSIRYVRQKPLRLYVGSLFIYGLAMVMSVLMTMTEPVLLLPKLRFNANENIHILGVIALVLIALGGMLLGMLFHRANRHSRVDTLILMVVITGCLLAFLLFGLMPFNTLKVLDHVEFDNQVYYLTSFGYVIGQYIVYECDRWGVRCQSIYQQPLNVLCGLNVKAHQDPSLIRLQVDSTANSLNVEISGCLYRHTSTSGSK